MATRPGGSEWDIIGCAELSCVKRDIARNRFFVFRGRRCEMADTFSGAARGVGGHAPTPKLGSQENYWLRR